METLEEALRRLIKDEYGSIPAFAEVVDIPANSIYNALNRGLKNTRTELTDKIYRELNIDWDTASLTDFHELKLKSQSKPQEVEVPLLSRIAAGTPLEMEDYADSFPIPARLRDKYPDAFLLRVDGESMNRIIPNGCYALVDPCDEVLHDGKPYAICVNGYDATIKRVHKPSSMGKFHQVLFEVMQQAVDDGKLARNPMASVKRPRLHVAEREALSPDELQLFLNRVDELPTDGRTVALYMMACLGLRCGEACALRDEQFGETATVDSTVRAADRSIGRPKSSAGARTLPVPPRLAAKVGEWREVRRCIGLDGSETLCCNKRGGVMTTSAMENWWRCTARAKLGCDGMTLHQLRHSNLSMMARHMSVFDLQRYAGWSSIAPARIYVHDDLDAVTRAVEMAWK